jgi:uncharacterized membrane protein
MGRYFIAGVLIVVPLVVTYLVLKFLFETIDGILAPAVDAIFARHIPGVGLLATILLIFVAGIVGAGVLGQKLVRLWEKWLTRIPLIRVVYGSAKQLLEATAVPGSTTFMRVGLIEYPRDGVYSICFLTKHVEIKRDSGGDTYMSVFVPQSPTPFAGFVAFAKPTDIIWLDMSVEEGVKMVVSGGIVLPPVLMEKTEG